MPSLEAVKAVRWFQRLSSVYEFDMLGRLFDEACSTLHRSDLDFLLRMLDAKMSVRDVNAQRIVRSLFVLNLTSCDVRTERLAEVGASSLAVCLRHQLILSPADAWKIATEDQLLPKDDRRLTLGERRARARLANPQIINELLNDPDQIVITHLLQNPRMTREMVMKLATRRPASGASLSAIFRSAKYGACPKLQYALVQNPYAPYRLILGLVYCFPTSRLRALIREPALSDFVVRSATNELASRRC